MSQIQPETIAVQLTERLNQLYASKNRYVTRDDFEYRQLLRDCEKLMAINACHAYVSRGMAHLLTGEIGLIKQDIGRARELDPESWHYCDFMLTQALAKLGYFSEAQPFFLSSADPELGRFGFRSNIGIVIGALNTLNEMFTQADEMNLNYESTIDRQGLEMMVAILRDAGVDDTQVATMMDIAGQVAREHSLRIKQQESRVMDLDGERFIHICLKVKCPAREAADMVFEVADRISELEIVPPAVHVSFASV